MKAHWRQPAYQLLCALPALLLMFASSCSRETTEQKLVLKTVNAYNTALADAYRDMERDYLKPFASDRQVSYIQSSIISYRQNGRKMMTRQDEFKVRDIRKEGDGMAVETDEAWSYWMEEISTKAIAEPKKVVKYHVVYHMKRPWNTWIVDSLDLK